jgi:hypothetical protein
MTAIKTTAAAILIVAALAAANYSRPYDCTTDSECEAEEAARCWILCQ